MSLLLLKLIILISMHAVGMEMTLDLVCFQHFRNIKTKNYTSLDLLFALRLCDLLLNVPKRREMQKL